MKRVFAALLCIVPLFLGGCAGAFDREFYQVSPHLEQKPQEGETASLRASNQKELQNAMLRLVRARSEEGVIRLSGYSGDVRRDLLTSIDNVSRAEPIGAYAVGSITYERTPLLTDYEVKLFITYRRTEEQMNKVLYVAGQSSLQAELSRAMSRFDTELVVETTYYDRDLMDLEAMMTHLYYQNPQYAMGLPELTYTLYPDDADTSENDLRRIIEMNLSYPHDAYTQNVYAAAAELRANGLLRSAPDMDSAGLALWLRDRLCALIAYDHDTARQNAESGGTAEHGDAYTIYGAMEHKLAVGEGYALAYKMLCDAVGIENQIVVGKRGGDDHAWNVIRLTGDWYHVDVAADDMGDEPTYEWFLRPDSAMQPDYRFNPAGVPPCESEKLSFAIVAEQYFPVLYEEWLASQQPTEPDVPASAEAEKSPAPEPEVPIEEEPEEPAETATE